MKSFFQNLFARFKKKPTSDSDSLDESGVSEQTQAFLVESLNEDSPSDEGTMAFEIEDIVKEEEDLPPSKPEKKVKVKESKGIKNLKNFPEKFLSVSNRANIHLAFKYIFFFCLIFIFGRLVGALADHFFPKAEVRITRGNQKINKGSIEFNKNLKVLEARDLFRTNQDDGPKEIKTKVVINEDKKCESSDKESRLPIKLLNTIVLQDSVKSVASVQIRSKNKPEEYREGEKIDNLAMISKIDRLELIIKNLKTGDCESIESSKKDKAPPRLVVTQPGEVVKAKEIQGISRDGNTFTLSKKLIQAKLSNCLLYTSPSPRDRG